MGVQISLLQWKREWSIQPKLAAYQFWAAALTAKTCGCHRLSENKRPPILYRLILGFHGEIGGKRGRNRERHEGKDIEPGK